MLIIIAPSLAQATPTTSSLAVLIALQSLREIVTADMSSYLSDCI